MRDVLEALLDEIRAGRAAVLATVVRSSGSTPRTAGAKMLVGADASTRSAGLAAKLRQWWGGRLAAGWQPLAAALAVLAVVLGVTQFLTRPPRERQWTQQDVQRAELQVRWVLAHLGEVSRQAGEVVKKDVLEEHVATPTARATERALQDALASPQAR